jgi:hypothetical protein
MLIYDGEGLVGCRRTSVICGESFELDRRDEGYQARNERFWTLMAKRFSDTRWLCIKTALSRLIFVDVRSTHQFLSRYKCWPLRCEEWRADWVLYQFEFRQSIRNLVGMNGIIGTARLDL